ncbi:PLP-dependent aminotransferase family protein [Acetobacterium wieringae]|uniref:PLP-dependent aminotransferase family protein n=2 Tax=Acetobacterium wieringae TaxID=52694 RepID=A0ABY6HJS6_9FIRM|nr:PLP-dependent aminotransferase family protein [Acetobacterium wieringae]UYO63694.1 PLP-dependent aminotransferase family protein [Acetobacterium wieringae]VUZ27491.1 HTH-type transcriptional regulatory protein GabR [Acetobacterium wieringae]
MLTIPFKNKGSFLYAEIYEFIKQEITDGNLKYGEKLPSKRSLASHLAVSVNTVDTAYSQLVAEGYLEAIPKRGYFVCQIATYLMKDANRIQDKRATIKKTEVVTIDFSPNAIDQRIFPYDAFRKIFKSTFNEDDNNLLNKPDIQGELELRKALVDLLYHSRGVRCHEEQIIIGSGTDHLLQILGLLWGRNKPVILENPVYLKAYHIFEKMGNPVISIDIDEKGIQIEPLKNYSNVAIYVTPSHQFPLGMSMPIDRRIRLLNFANQEEGNYIIEDDYDSEFRYNEKPLPSLQSIDNSGRVIYMGTFSKSIAPSFRISYMVLPEELLKAYQETAEAISSPVSSLEQKMIAAFIASGFFEKHVNKMRKVYKGKRIVLMNALKNLGSQVKITGENAGHHLLVQLDNGLTEEEMYHRALARGIRVYPVSPYFIHGLPKHYKSMVLLGYGSLTDEQIHNGIGILKKAWDL